MAKYSVLVDYGCTWSEQRVVEADDELEAWEAAAMLRPERPYEGVLDFTQVADVEEVS